MIMSQQWPKSMHFNDLSLETRIAASWMTVVPLHWTMPTINLTASNKSDLSEINTIIFLHSLQKFLEQFFNHF